MPPAPSSSVPAPYGTCADIAAIAGVCHERGKPLIIDEARGAHLPFHDDLPTWAMDAGADVCVVSVHKMGAGFEQGSVFHVQGDLVDGAHLSACADLLMTTSPNRLLGKEASHDLDRLQILIDVSETGATGYQCADWLRGHCQLDVGMSDHRRIPAADRAHPQPLILAGRNGPLAVVRCYRLFLRIAV
jgi:arginine/lysine/ornithine decarboxylase